MQNDETDVGDTLQWKMLKGQLPFIYDGCQNDSDDNDNRNGDISYGLVFSQQLVQGACLPKSLILIPY